MTFSKIDMENTPSRADYPGANAVYLHREGKYQIEVISTFSEHIILKVLEEGGKRYADVKIPFWDECEVLELKARTIKPNGQIINLDDKDVYEVTDFPEFIMYADRKAKVFSFPSVDTGCVLEYYYTIGYAGPFVPPWYFQAAEPVRLAKFTYDVPFFLGFKYSVVSLVDHDVEEDIQESAGGNIGVFTVRDLPALKYEPLAPAKNDVTSWILMAWSSFYHILLGKVSSGQENWFQMGRTYSMWVDSLHEAGKEVEKKVQEITAGCRNDEDKIRAIYAFIQDRFRYVAVEIAGHRIFPNPPAEVLRNQYGDCKDLSGLLISMLRVADVDAYPVLVKTKKAGQFIRTLPTFSQMDHVIVAVPLRYFRDESAVRSAVLRGVMESSKEDDFVIIDPTASTRALGFLHAGIQGRYAVLCAGMDSKLVTLPSAHLGQNMSTSRVQFNLDGSEYDGTISIEAIGEEAAWLRHQFLHSSPTETKEFVHKFLGSFPLSMSLDTFALRAVSGFDSTLHIDISFNKYSSLQTSKGQVLVPVLFRTLPEFQELYDCYKRTHNVEFRFPYKHSDMFRLVVPADYTVSSMPERESVKNDWCEYTCISYRCGDTVVVNRNIAVKECLIPRSDFAEIRDFSSRVLDSSHKLVILARN